MLWNSIIVLIMITTILSRKFFATQCYIIIAEQKIASLTTALGR
jgi:hypothetical protein